MHRLYRALEHVASRSAYMARTGCHVTHIIGRAPLLLIGRAISIIGGAIPIIAVNYGILVACWMLHMFQVVQGKLIRRAIALQSSWRSTSLFLDAFCTLACDLYNSSAIHKPSCGEQFVVNGKNSSEPRLKSTVNDGDLRDWQHLLQTLDFLDSDRIYAVLVLQCVCCSGKPIMDEAHAKQMHDVVVSTTSKKRSGRRRRDGLGHSFRRIVARNEWCVTYAVVVATMQLLLRLTGANVTTLLLPMLSRATTGGGNGAFLAAHAVLILVNAGGVLGSALAARLYGREVMCVVGGVLIVFCQVVIPAAMGTHGVGGGGGAYAAVATFVVACAASGGCGWSWGAAFWAVPGPGEEGVRSAVGAALGFALGFAQTHCFLLMLRQLKRAALAYYAVWIWS
uniref:Major facilitator superfamily (MFS) profile domain-containing protein n=1 Tax=Leersia perrieri TaxID=77586 RepID=A0A0D9W5Q3_9ORYZ